MRARRIGQIGSAMALGVMLVLASGTAAEGRAVQQQTQMPPHVPRLPTAVPDQPPDDVPPDVRAHMDAQRARALNDDRHKHLVEDASKLIALSNELKTEIDKANKDELSLEVIRKAAAIEKLAHDVQNRMKN